MDYCNSYLPLHNSNVRTTLKSSHKVATQQQAFDLFEEHRKEYLAHCRDVAERIFYFKGHVTTDDIRTECPVPSMFNATVLGAVFRDGRWEKSGIMQTSVKSSHGRDIKIWVLKPEYRSYKRTSLSDASQMSLL